MKNKKIFAILIILLLILTVTASVILINQSNQDNTPANEEISSEEISTEEEEDEIEIAEEKEETEIEEDDDGDEVEVDVSDTDSTDDESDESIMVGDEVVSGDAELVILSNGEGISYFTIENLMPGDVEYQQFDLRITYEDNVKINYSFNEDEDCSRALLENLRIEVYLPQIDEVIFEGCFAEFELNEQYIYLVQSETDESYIYYEIKISLPEETGNECMNEKISGQFVWTSEQVDVISDDAEYTIYAPKTGDDSDYVIYLIALIVSGLGVIALLYRRNRRGNN